MDTENLASPYIGERKTLLWVQLFKTKYNYNQAAANQVEKNKLANSVQTTEKTNTATQDAVKKLATQKVPLNTTNTGASMGSSSAVGLNLGGY